MLTNLRIGTESSTRRTWIIRSTCAGRSFRLSSTKKGGKITMPLYRAWNDTVNIVAGETFRILLRQDMPGPRMYHCHILEHEQFGMMGTIDVRA